MTEPKLSPITESELSELISKAIDEFDPKKVDFEAIKKNVISYSSINMMHGRLRSEIVPPLLDDVTVSVNPAAAEQEDRQRQIATQETQPEAPDPKIIKRLMTLYERSNKYPPFNYKQNITNALYAIVAITGHVPTAEDFKARYISSLNAIQNTSVPYHDTIVVSFDNPALLNELCREGLITPAPGHLFSPPEQDHIVRRITDALAFIKAVDTDLHDAIRFFIGTIACIRREGTSGTVSSVIGLLWLNPDPTWSIVDYAENLIHEYIHNTIFLSDLVWKIFTKPHWYTPEDGLVLSAIKKYPRGVNIAYHSLFVAMGLIIFLEKAKQHKRAEDLTTGLRETLSGLKDKAENFLSPYATETLKRVSL